MVEGETIYEYNQKRGLTTTRQEKLDKIVGRPIEKDWFKDA